MSKATPGPWHLDRWDDAITGHFGWMIFHKEGRVPISTFEGDEEEAYANVRLIAAAPDLLAELRRCIALIEGEVPASAIAAVVKATGEK